MPASYGTIRAVNPVSLAEVSGVTKVPGFASSPVPPVIRPDLLTSQLMGCHPQCETCNGTNAGPAGHTGFASYIPPDYGTLRGMGANGGAYGIFKVLSSSELPPLQSAIKGSLGKGATGTHASDYNTRWMSGRGLGKGAVGNNTATSGTRYWSFGLRALGQTTTDSTPGTFQKLLNNLLSAFRPGASEADVIVNQAQNPLMSNLGNITNQFLTSSNPSLATLQALYAQVAAMAQSFKNFVLSSQFTDRRASGQALNTVMPIIDGTCGYAVPLPHGNFAAYTQSNCTTWGAGTLGGPGTTGMLGALQRAIANAGGSTPFISPTGQVMTSGLPSTIAGLPTSTVLLIVAGVFLISRMK